MNIFPLHHTTFKLQAFFPPDKLAIIPLRDLFGADGDLIVGIFWDTCNVRPKLYTPGNLLGKFQKKGVVQTRHLLTLFSHDSQYFISQNSAKHGKLNGNP
jgi:hypothetical protein